MQMLARALILSVSLFVLPAGLVTAAKKDAKEEQADSQQKVSKEASKPFKAAQDAMTAQNYPEALAKLREVQALPKRSPYEEHLLNEMYGFVYLRTNEYAEAAKALEAGLNSGFLPEADVPQRVKALSQIYYQLKDYDKAIEYGNRAVTGGFADENLYTLISQAYYLKPDYAGTKRFVGDYVDSQIAKGVKPSDQSLQLVMSSCVKLEDQACLKRSLERLVEYYPKPEYWQNLIYSMLTPATVKDSLQIYRLAFELDVVSRADDYLEMAQLSMQKGLPGEAQKFLEKALAKGAFTEKLDKTTGESLLASAKQQASTDKASLTRTSDTANAKTGTRDLGMGLAYYSYGQYPEAVQSISNALSKGGLVKGADADAYLVLGISQFKAGNKDKAKEAFAQVKGNPTLERLARLWSIHIGAPLPPPA